MFNLLLKNKVLFHFCKSLLLFNYFQSVETRCKMFHRKKKKGIARPNFKKEAKYSLSFY